ncbi:MAG TPA: nuclear transport factor 2 family protein [Nocardioides sp.]|uniref:nuclear transport factor 2 family protein n=1 Tax=Nocardioides sp. TaxID=35761 RepID=UPI002E36533F|nr:nuclear transport factor 2 family protein [Nocardioides sp.]HEX3930842.1 nuclear transport factor 2 family protein [Nocardioides sp.]
MITTQVRRKATDELVVAEEIRELLMRRGRAADGKSPERIVAQHEPGSRDSHGIFEGTIEEFAEFLRTHNYQDDRYGVQRHTIGNLLISGRTPDLVAVESYHLAYHRLVIDGVAHDVQVGGRYLDVCKRSRAGWRILSRAVVYDWSRSSPATRADLPDTTPRHMPLGGTVNALRPHLQPTGRSTVRGLLAKQEITELLYLRARAGDRRDVELALSCYHPGATENHEGFEGHAADFISNVSMISPASTAPVSGMWHLISNVVINLHDDRADVESYHLAVVSRRDDGHETQSHIGGRYLDTFSYRNGRWAIDHREVVFDWSRVDTDTVAYWDLMRLDESMLLRGEFGATDPLYSVLGIERG